MVRVTAWAAASPSREHSTINPCVSRLGFAPSVAPQGGWPGSSDARRPRSSAPSRRGQLYLTLHRSNIGETCSAYVEDSGCERRRLTGSFSWADGIAKGHGMEGEQRNHERRRAGAGESQLSLASLGCVGRCLLFAACWGLLVKESDGPGGGRRRIHRWRYVLRRPGRRHAGDSVRAGSGVHLGEMFEDDPQLAAALNKMLG